MIHPSKYNHFPFLNKVFLFLQKINQNFILFKFIYRRILDECCQFLTFNRCLLNYFLTLKYLNLNFLRGSLNDLIHLHQFHPFYK